MNAICGFRPTGRLHVGHYFSVIVPGRQSGVTTLVADYHALGELTETQTARLVDLLRSAGVSRVMRQKDVFVPEVYFRLLAIAGTGHLERMTQYKSSKLDKLTAHLLTYPVLMTHDVLGYKKVLVGDDQVQHIEYARDLISKYNRQFGFNFDLPEAHPVGGRVMDLREPLKKMSKSSPAGCVFLDDSLDEIRAKLRKASVCETGRKNLEGLWSHFSGDAPPTGNMPLKHNLADLMAEKFRPFLA